MNKLTLNEPATRFFSEIINKPFYRFCSIYKLFHSVTLIFLFSYNFFERDTLRREPFSQFSKLEFGTVGEMYVNRDKTDTSDALLDLM